MNLKNLLPPPSNPKSFDLFVYDQAVILADQTLSFAVTVHTANKRLK